MTRTNDGCELSVIIPVRNGARSLPELLTSINAQTLARERFEVIVVDNGSVDGTGEIAAAHGARVIRERIANRARARNSGVAAARSALYAFTDADCVADKRWLEQLLAHADHAPLVAGDVKVRTGGQPNVVQRYEAIWRFGQKHWVRHEGWAATANLLVRRDVFTTVGGFDPAWRHIGEDVDFCLRARGAGFRLDYCADAIVEHDAEREMRPFLKRCFLHGYSVNQAFYRLGAGHRAWRHPLPAVLGDRALRDTGHSPNGFDPVEWQKMARLARVGYAARVAGSLWAEMVRAR